jgi:5-dehydro-2-deoxygluconokinase
VDTLPEHNTGALINTVTEFIFDDAAIVACLLRQWGVQSGLVGTALGDDPRGRQVAHQLKEWGVLGEVRLSKDLTTPFEVDISDMTGARTYFWQRAAEVLNTLDTADLSLLAGARLLYVDWYDGEHILRAMDEAIHLGIPVFLNLEHGHADADILSRFAGRATICQAVTDAAQRDCEDPLAVARKLLAAGVETALITLAADGCLVVRGDQAVRAYAPSFKAVDGCGAGATFSTGFIYGYLKGWDLEKSVRFATAAASLKVTRPGLQMFPIQEIITLAAKIEVEHL